MKRDYQMRVYQYPNGDSFEWVVEFPDLPGCIGAGDTIEEALSEAQINKDLWIEAAIDIGRSIPTPSDSYSIEYSGKFNIRIPKSLHRDLVLKAEEEDVSLNALCSTLLSRGIETRSSTDSSLTTSTLYAKIPNADISHGKWDEHEDKVIIFRKTAV